jgi:hypothetical protein
VNFDLSAAGKLIIYSTEENDRRTSNFARLASSQETDKRFSGSSAWNCRGGTGRQQTQTW